MNITSISSNLSKNDELLVVHMDFKPFGPIKMLSYCLSCETPEHEGSYADALIPKHLSPIISSVTGKLIYCVPNFADMTRIFNEDFILGNIILVDRGKIPILEKCLRIQEAGAAGIVIADDNQCVDDFSFCGSRAGNKNEGGFSSNDDSIQWKRVNIPVLLITSKSAEKLRNLMKLKRVEIHPHGYHHVTLQRNHEGGYDEL